MAYTKPSGPDETLLSGLAATQCIRAAYPKKSRRKWPYVLAAAIWLAIVGVFLAGYLVTHDFSGTQSPAASGPPGVVVDENGETWYQWGMGPGPDIQ